jgi:hypothetical protein
MILVSIIFYIIWKMNCQDNMLFIILKVAIVKKILILSYTGDIKKQIAYSNCLVLHGVAKIGIKLLFR